MKNDDRKPFAEALWATADVIGKPVPNERALGLYWAVLEKYSLEDVLSGLSAHLRDPDVGQFMPKPADIIRNIDGSSETVAMLAWTKALKAASNIGSYKTVVFDDWRIHAVIRDMGGWIDFCGMSVDDQPYRARDFEKRYRGYAKKQESPYPKALIGRIEFENTQKGLPVDTVVMIGDSRNAALVFERGLTLSAMRHVNNFIPPGWSKKLT